MGQRNEEKHQSLQQLHKPIIFRAPIGTSSPFISFSNFMPCASESSGSELNASPATTLISRGKSTSERIAVDFPVPLSPISWGTMLVREFAGMKVQEAKSLIRSKLLELGQAVVYSEPEKKVMSRSGDECVMALTDQWYITYGESEWKKSAEECLADMNLYSDEVRHGFEHTLSWLNQWACSRSFGLGTRIPWDEDFLVESLSDSTLYMAYYTVAHLLQRGDMYGTDKSLVKPEQLTDEVWDFLFVGGPYPESSDISSSQLSEMKKEFEYWYPFDLGVSGKDLIHYHLPSE